MSNDDARSLKSLRRDRSRSPLKAIPYEQASNGLPPRRVVAPGVTEQTTPSPPSSARASHLSTMAPFHPATPPRRPRSSPSSRTGDRASVLSSEVKRDSGFATSISNGGTSSTYAESRLSSTTTTAVAREPSLPTIVVQDEEGAGDTVERSRSRRQSTDQRDVTQSVSPPRIAASGGVDKIATDIPSGALDEINLEDLATDKVGFSKRGSLLFGGRKMKKFLEGRSAEASSSSVSLPAPRKTKEDVALEGELSSSGLQTARRRAESQVRQMPETAGGRVLSADEVSFSFRVRSMYEHGDERAPEWITMTPRGHSRGASTASSVRSTSTPDLGSPSLTVGKKRPPVGGRVSNSPRLSFYAKEPTELAGGIEDWGNVDGFDVDRYGFINASTTRAFSRDSEASSMVHGEGLHRVATSLRLEASQPRRERKLTRRASNARSSRSVPPPRPISRVSTAGKTAASIRSIHSSASASRASVFRSREKRLLSEASDMLTLPPGLADIAEHEDAGRTASMLKQREWAREEKWQKMARPVRDRNPGAQASVGGGMRFDFDTHDAKLISRTWKGIPDRWRATAWHSFLSASARQRRSTASDDELVGQFHKLQAMSSADDVQIDVDVPRTISKHIMFRRRYRGGQRLLFRVLHAISLYFPGTGYVQGMASLAATLLCYFDEEHAFVMMVRLWQLRGLEQLFQPGFDGLMAALRQFEDVWLGGGDVARKLEELGVSSTAYGTRWYLTLFSMSVPFPAQLRIWDVFMLLGDLPASVPQQQQGEFGGADLGVLHATSAALVDATREIILDSDFENAMKVLTSFVPIKDEDLLMRVARAEWKMKRGKKT